MNDNACAPADRDALLDHLAAELTCAAYHVSLRHAAPGTWLELELDLWQALAETVKRVGTENKLRQTPRRAKLWREWRSTSGAG
jgi:hypothetical protein